MSGSNKRMRDLQALFETPPKVCRASRVHPRSNSMRRLLPEPFTDMLHYSIALLPSSTTYHSIGRIVTQYGKNLDWKKEVYTPHDVASVFRRYLTMMPEPVIPYNLYSKVCCYTRAYFALARVTVFR